jgi:hypothetical protein
MAGERRRRGTDRIKRALSKGVGLLRSDRGPAGVGWRDRLATQRLAHRADRLTVVDASPETLDLNRERVGRTDVNYMVAHENHPDHNTSTLSRSAGSDRAFA